MGSSASADVPYVEPRARELRRPSWMGVDQPVQPAKILVYVRVGGLRAGEVSADSAPVRLLCEGFVSVLAEIAETDESTVKDFGGHEATLSVVPCQHALGLIFGGFLAAADLAKHRYGRARTCEDVRDALLSDAARARLEASAVMPAHLICPESSCLLDVCVADDASDPRGTLVENCPWDLHHEEWPVQIPEANLAGKQMSWNLRPSLDAALSLDFCAIKAQLRATPVAPTYHNMLGPSNHVAAQRAFNHHETLHIVEDYPDVPILDEGLGDGLLEALVGLEASCSLLEASPCCMLDPHDASFSRPPQSCFPCVR